jgi:hypothetical protein
MRMTGDGKAIGNRSGSSVKSAFLPPTSAIVSSDYGKLGNGIKRSLTTVRAADAVFLSPWVSFLLTAR